jgi:cell division ATPase FtsA
VQDLVLQPLASSMSVLTGDEKELGVALVDIGGGTTDIAIYERGALWHTAVIGVGGDHFTNDIAVGLRTPVPEAEKIKRKCGCALSAMVDEDETMEVASVGGRKPRVMARRILSEILQPLASSMSVLTGDEKELGVALVDIGGGTTDIAIFTGGAIRHTAVIPIAGDQVTNDIAMALRTPIPDAEQIKQRYGVAKEVLADPNDRIEIPGVGDRAPRLLSRQSLAAVIEPRVEELFTLAHKVIRDSGYEEMLSSGIVLTGGTALLPGIGELAEDVFLKPARVGWPHYQGPLADVIRNPRFATVAGLLLEAQSQRQRGRRAAAQNGSFGQTLKRMREWIVGNF